MIPEEREFKKELLNFFKSLNRAFFIDNEYESMAQEDLPLPIGYDQTISQPSLVFDMTVMLDVENAESVLEIGTGSGYQTAFLAKFAKKVYTVELIEELSRKAQERLKELGFGNIRFKIGDGSEGWKEYAPYDRIIVTAGSRVIPDELVEQLKNGGKMVIPVGNEYEQELLLIEKDLVGKLSITPKYRVRFVEFKGKYGWRQDNAYGIIL